MTTLTKYTPEAASAIRTLAAGQLRWSLNHAVNTFEAVPEDKLDYKPSETAKSCREQIEHLLFGNDHVGKTLGLNLNAMEGPNDRPALVARLKSSTEAIAEKIETVSDEDMGSMVEFFAPMPMTVFVMVDAWHIARHAGQIDYLQTTWGDLEDRF
jgi:hypothetical protein